MPEITRTNHATSLVRMTPFDPGPTVASVVDSVLSRYDANDDGLLSYGTGGEHGVTGEALRSATNVRLTPHGPLLLVDETMAIQSLIIAADAVDGSMNGSVSRLDLMTVVGSFDVTGDFDPSTGSRRDQRLDHAEFQNFERLFRERVVDVANAQAMGREDFWMTRSRGDDDAVTR